jgi:hypothetical protein
MWWGAGHLIELADVVRRCVVKPSPWLLAWDAMEAMRAIGAHGVGGEHGPWIIRQVHVLPAGELGVARIEQLRERSRTFSQAPGPDLQAGAAANARP